MRATYLSDKIRKEVAERAGNQCEYCQISEEDTYISCEVDHVISVKHGGTNALDNLAFACFPCNRFKGSDIATLDNTGEIIRLFNPRSDDWDSFFFIENGVLNPKNSIGEATINLLRLNDASRVEERIEISKNR